MKNLLALFIGASAILIGASMANASEIGEALTEDKPIIEETSTNPPPHEEGQEEFGEIDGKYHRVKKDDTLWKIAGYYHVDFGELLDLNTHFIDPDLIYPSDLVKLPSNQVQGIQEAYKIKN